ncbi:MAG: GAF domain-containing sensor histidine kinase [Acidimicrobiales bacterium]
MALRRHVAGALRSPLELKEALRLVAGVALDQTNADHCSMFLLEDGRLLPGVALRHEQSPDAWQAMKALAPIRLDAKKTDAFADGRAVVIDDIRGNDLVPQSVTEGFGLCSLAMIAMRHDDVICGVLVVGRDEVRPFSGSEVDALAPLADRAARAIVLARPFETVRRDARRQEVLARASATLSEPLADEEIASTLVEAFSQATDNKTCAVALIDEDQVRMTSVVSTLPVERRMPILFSDIPVSIVRYVQRAWLESSAPAELEIDAHRWVADLFAIGVADINRYLLIPLLVSGQIRGAVVLGFGDEVALDTASRRAVDYLVAVAQSALERHELLRRLDRKVRHLEALHALGTDAAADTDAELLRKRLALVLKDSGIEVLSLAFKDRALARQFQSAKASVEEKAAWRSDTWQRLADGTSVVPMHAGAKVIGGLRIAAADLGRSERLFVEVLANGLAEAATARSLRQSVEESTRDQALQRERSRMAADLHDSVGQLLMTIHLMAGGLVDDLATASAEQAQVLRLAEMASEGKRTIDDAVRALSFVPAARRGLAPSLRALCASIQQDSGITVAFDVNGRTARLSPPVERALYRVAHEALANAWRHARCRGIEVELHFGSLDVSLRVADDGPGRKGDTPTGGFRMGLVNMRRAIDEVGGTFEVTSRRPRGMVIEARVPRARRPW